jgi:hypothetical protein
MLDRRSSPPATSGSRNARGSDARRQHAKPQSELPRKPTRLQLKPPAEPRRRLERRGALSRPGSRPPRRPNGRRLFLRSAERAGRRRSARDTRAATALANLRASSPTILWMSSNGADSSTAFKRRSVRRGRVSSMVRPPRKSLKCGQPAFSRYVGKWSSCPKAVISRARPFGRIDLFRPPAPVPSCSPFL